MARPRIIKTPKQFDELADAYFRKCGDDGEPILLSGLILALGLSSRESLDEYGRRQEFFDSVKRAKLHVEMEYEKRLCGTAPTGAIFALKNFGWSDRQDVELTGKGGSPLQVPDIIVKFVEPKHKPMLELEAGEYEVS